MIIIMICYTLLNELVLVILVLRLNLLILLLLTVILLYSLLFTLHFDKVNNYNVFLNLKTLYKF
jgi:hypothetical protein